MSTDELTALAELTFNWTRALDDVWTDQRYHVEGLHAVTADLIRKGIREAGRADARPLGIVIQGERGVGKTHLLGWTREQVQRAGGYFFLVGDLFTKAFWEQVLGSVVEQLLPLPDGSRNQLETLLTGLADRVGLNGDSRAQITGQVPPSPGALKVFIAALRRTDPSLGLICQDTARALALLASPLQEDQDVGYYYLTGNEVDLQDRRRWGINSTRKIARLLVNEVSQLLALTGPIVIAIDQVDALIDELVGVGLGEASQSRPLADVATGLMSLRDVAHRTLTIVSCLPKSWEYISKYGSDTVVDRFRMARRMQNIPSAYIGRLMIAKRFAADFALVGFEPPYATWPILPDAFDDASRYTARGLLRRVEAHVDGCLRERSVAELDRLDEERVAALPPPAEVTAASPDLAALDDLFTTLRESAVVGAALDHQTEDAAMPPLLAAGLEACCEQRRHRRVLGLMIERGTDDGALPQRREQVVKRRQVRRGSRHLGRRRQGGDPLLIEAVELRDGPLAQAAVAVGFHTPEQPARGVPARVIESVGQNRPGRVRRLEADQREVRREPLCDHQTADVRAWDVLHPARHAESVDDGVRAVLADVLPALWQAGDDREGAVGHLAQRHKTRRDIRDRPRLRRLTKADPDELVDQRVDLVDRDHDRPGQRQQLGNLVDQQPRDLPR